MLTKADVNCHDTYRELAKLQDVLQCDQNSDEEIPHFCLKSNQERLKTAFIY